MAWKRNRNIQYDRSPRAVLNALSNDTNRADKDGMVPEISVIYCKCIIHKIDKKSIVGGDVVMHFSKPCQYFQMNIFLPEDAAFQALQNRAISKMAFFYIRV